MTTIAKIKNMGIMCDDVATHILLDFMVGDKKHWKTKFNHCINAMNDMRRLYYEDPRGMDPEEYNNSHMIMIWIIKHRFTNRMDPQTYHFIKYPNRRDRKWINRRFKESINEAVSCLMEYEFDDFMEYWNAEELIKNKENFPTMFLDHVMGEISNKCWW